MGAGGCVKGNIKSSRQVQAELDQKFGDNEYKLLGKHTGYQNVHRFRHSCGRVFEAKLESLKRGYKKCPCQLSKPTATGKSLEQHRKEVQEWRGPDFDCLEYSGKGKSTYLHIPCGHQWQTTWRSFRLSKHCPHCAGTFAQDINRLSRSEIRRRIADVHGTDQYRLISEHVSINQSVTVKHIPCGHRYETKLDHLMRPNMGGKCPVCFPVALGRVKIVEIDGREYRLQGYEEYALRRLLKKYGNETIITGSQPERMSLRYVFKGKQHQYYPDFWLPNRKLAVEVKSMATLGLVRDEHAFFGEDVFERNQTKARTVIKRGYKYRLYVFGANGLRKQLPKNWYEMNKRDLAEWLGVFL